MCLAGPDGGQSWSGWQSAVDDTCLGVAVVEAGGQSTVVLHGLGMTRELALPATPDPGATRFRIVQAHGGTIWIEDNPAGGAIFAFTLPVMQMGATADDEG